MYLYPIILLALTAALFYYGSSGANTALFSLEGVNQSEEQKGKDLSPSNSLPKPTMPFPETFEAAAALGYVHDTLALATGRWQFQDAFVSGCNSKLRGAFFQGGLARLPGTSKRSSVARLAFPQRADFASKRVPA